MILTLSQQDTLKAHIAANTATVPWQGNNVQINALPNTPDANFAIAEWYNGTASPDYYVWRDVTIETVLNNVTMANFTPVDAVPTDTQLNVSIWQARSLACQGKQFNFQNLTIGRSTAPMKRSNYRAAMQDALTSIPSGVAGALLGGNWPAVRDSAKFLARNIEQIFATGAGTSGNPSDLAANVEGIITGNDIGQARNRP